MRVALVLALSAAYIGWHTHDAYAKKSGDDDSSSGDDDDDDDGGGGSNKGGDDDDDDDSSDKDQPPVTAGGLFTLKTYPQNEILRPLTITQGVTQLRLGIGTDISAKGAFGTAGVSLEGEYGVTDNFMLIGGLTDAYNFKQYSVYAGFEAALVYDLLDIRIAANLHRNAYADYQNYCSPLSSADPINPQDPATCGTAMGGVATPNATIVNLPDGNYHAGGTKFSIDLGFPFRYAFKPQIAIVALQTLISIDFNSVTRDHVLPQQVGLVDSMGNPIMDSMGNQLTETVYTPVGNGAKPDLEPSLGVAFNPIPQLSIVAFAQLKIPDFDTSAGAFQIPVTLRIEASASRQLDFGLEFTLLNVDPPDPQSPIDNRYISAYAQARF
jgi:hypothetical protein